MSDVANGQFANKVVLVTGASSGIGAELARQLSVAGARVALAARDMPRLETVAAQCRANGVDPFVVQTDVSIETSCRDAVNATVAHYGHLDILINNAGLGARGRFDQITDLSIFEKVMRVNFFGSVWCTAYALPHLKKSRGQVVAVSSLTGVAGVPNRTAYGATKHAMAGFFDSLRVELHDSGVSVTVIYPGFVNSEITERGLATDGKPFGERGYKRPDSEKMSTEECCRLILRAMARRDRELLMTWRGKVGRLLKLISPKLVDRIAMAAMAENRD